MKDLDPEEVLKGKLAFSRHTLRCAKDKNVILQNRINALESALRVSLEAMQVNIAYATRKDELALVRGIDAARSVL